MKHQSTCKCGRTLNYIISPHMTNEVRSCECGEKHYVDTAPVDWEKIRTKKGEVKK